VLISQVAHSMSKSSSNENPKKLMNELGELVDFLSDGPELQGELGLPNHLDVPVLTVKVGEDTEEKAETDLDALVDDLVKLVLPRLETELRSRLKKKISDLPD
jgi:hypothetical protein